MNPVVFWLVASLMLALLYWQWLKHWNQRNRERFDEANEASHYASNRKNLAEANKELLVPATVALEILEKLMNPNECNPDQKFYLASDILTSSC